MSWLRSRQNKANTHRTATRFIPDILTDPKDPTTPPIIVTNQPGNESTASEQWKRFFSNSNSATQSASLDSSRTVVLSTQNLRQNKTWGDVATQKCPEHTRLYAINVNGLSLDRRGGKFDTICRALKELQVDIFCAQEHNVDTTQTHLRSIIFDTANQHWERNRIGLGTTPITVPTPYKPGGTMIMTVGSLTGRVSKQTRDKWGRWTCQEYQGKSNQYLVVVSVYQPIVKGPIDGKITVAAQHRSLLLQSADTTDNPRTAFRRDLTICVRNYLTKGYDILLVGDFNEELGSDPDGMSKLAGEFGLVDLMTSRHSSKLPATYSRGSKCLDYALASPHVDQSLHRCGYEEFNNRIPSDHRGMFFDFNTTKLFGTKTQTLISRHCRELKSSNTQQVTAYILRKHDLLTSSNAFHRAERLLYLGNRHSYAERIDKDMLHASLTAEKDLPKFREPKWSNELAQARRKVNLLTKHLSALRTGIDHSHILEKENLQLDIPIVLPTTRRECSSQLRQSKIEVNNIVQNSFSRRDDERLQRIQELEKSVRNADRAHAKKLRCLKKAEDLKQLFSKLKYVRTQGSPRQGVTRVEIPSHPSVDPKTCTTWTQIDVPSEVLQLLQERNRTHFGQAHGTPFTISPLSEQLGFCGSGIASQSILTGDYDTSDLEENVQLLIAHLKQVTDLQNNPSRPTITEQELRDKLKVWTESTTTSPSGLHLGHFKVLIARHSYSTDVPDEELTEQFKESRDDLNRKQQELLTFHLTLINYALERGYSFKRWHTIANTILFKDADNVRLHRTRVIHIYEADYNLALGVKWRAAMHQAEDFRSLNEGQYGSRANRNATDPVFIEEMQCEISRATRKPVVLTNYDATACYDRIIPNLGMIVSNKYGVPQTVTKTNASTLQQAEYRIRTELGLAPTGYSHTDKHPIYGTGQGSANSPAIWCFLSSSLFDCYDTKVHSAKYTDPSGKTMVELGMIGFVNDCNGQTNSFESDGSSDTVHRLLHHAQENAQQWNNILSASGGALEISKTSCHVLQWQFALNGAPVLQPHTPSHQEALHITDNITNVVYPLKLLSSYSAHKTLGHYKDPAGTQQEQFRQLKKKSDSNTSFLWKCPLSRLEAWTYYYACYLPSVGYPLSCSFMSEKQLDRIQRKAMSIIVARCGFNRNTRKSILYGPLELGGANFRHLYVQQGVSQVTTFIRHWRQGSVAGRLLRIAVSWFQLQVGVSFSFLENVHAPLPHLESKWLLSLRSFMSSIDISLRLDDRAIPPLQRLYDGYIMEIILNSNQFTPSEIRRLNYCRLYLKAVTLADLTHITGTRLDLSKREGDPSLYSSKTEAETIYQEKPGALEWQLWRRANKLWSTSSGSMHESLGPWLIITSNQRQRHQAYWYRGTDDPDIYIWVRIGQGYIQCVPTFDAWHFRETTIHADFLELPPDMSPCEVHLTAPGRWTMTYGGTLLVTPQLGTAATFDQYVRSLPPWEEELLLHIDSTLDPYSISDALTFGICAVSDGSVWDNHQGAYGWIISTDIGERCCAGMGPVCGAHPDSFRAEAYGMLTVLCYLGRLAEFTGQTTPWVGVLATDSQSLLDSISMRVQQNSEFPVLACNERELKQPHHLDVQGPEWDVISSILEKLHKNPGLHLQYVRGHQDNQVPYEQLPILAQLNVDADAMAARYQKQHSPTPIAFRTDTAGVHLVTPHGTVTSHFATTIRHQATHMPLLQHLQNKYEWTPAVSALINWKAHGSSLHSRISTRTHFVKLVHDILPTAKHLHRQDPIRSRCPCCSQAPEDWVHILSCTHETRSHWRDKFLMELESECATLHTRPLLTRILVDALQLWFTHPTDSFSMDHRKYPPEASRLIHHQNAIGWKQIFMGRFGLTWSDMQEDFYVSRSDIKASPKRRTGQRWQVLVIGIIWKHWQILWKQRNQDLHGADEKQQQRAITLQVRRELHAIYDVQAQLEPSVRALLHKDITSHLEKPTWVNRHWLAIHAPLVKASIKRARDKAIVGVKSIQHYFGLR